MVNRLVAPEGFLALMILSTNAKYYEQHSLLLNAMPDGAPAENVDPFSEIDTDLLLDRANNLADIDDVSIGTRLSSNFNDRLQAS